MCVCSRNIAAFEHHTCVHVLCSIFIMWLNVGKDIRTGMFALYFGGLHIPWRCITSHVIVYTHYTIYFIEHTKTIQRFNQFIRKMKHFGFAGLRGVSRSSVCTYKDFDFARNWINEFSFINVTIFFFFLVLLLYRKECGGICLVCVCVGAMKLYTSFFFLFL